MASTARLGEVYIGGDGRWPYGLGFGIGEKLEREEELDAVVRPEAFIGRDTSPTYR